MLTCPAVLRRGEKLSRVLPRSSVMVVGAGRSFLKNRVSPSTQKKKPFALVSSSRKARLVALFCVRGSVRAEVVSTDGASCISAAIWVTIWLSGRPLPGVGPSNVR